MLEPVIQSPLRSLSVEKNYLFGRLLNIHPPSACKGNNRNISWNGLTYREHHSSPKYSVALAERLLHIQEASFLQRRNLTQPHLTAVTSSALKCPHHEEHENSTQHHPCCTGIVISIRVSALNQRKQVDAGHSTI